MVAPIVCMVARTELANEGRDDPMKTMTQMSKLISLLLRHNPGKLGLTMDAHGWVGAKELVEALNGVQPFTMADLEHIVRTDNKQRYSFNADKTKIRANQGHSIPVDLELEPTTAPDELWHGTATRFTASIEREGLLPRGRQYVHLSPDEETATKVGRRHGKLALYVVDCAAMVADGYEFYISQNGVWLTNAVPPNYLRRYL